MPYHKNMPNVYSFRDNQLYIEDVSVQDIADTVGTAVYCYSQTRLEDNFKSYLNAFKEILPNSQTTICYACKANSNLSVLKCLAKLGAGADIVSSGELTRILRANIPTNKTVYSGVGKTDDELRYAIKSELLQINVESVEELARISDIATEMGKVATIALRVNPDVDAKTHEKISTGRSEDKFGIDIDLIPDLYEKTQTMSGVNLIGIAVHIGSQLTDFTPYEDAYKKTAELIKLLRSNGQTVTQVDLGGGVGISYGQNEPEICVKKYIEIIKKYIAPLNCHIIIEPGRSIAGDAGVLISKISYIKKGHTKDFAIIDAAMNDLMRPALYDAQHPLLTCLKKEDDSDTQLYDIVGPICETGDRFELSKELPRLYPNDLIAIMASGAYGAVMSSTYNSRPLIPEVMVSGDSFRIIRRKWTVENMLELEE